MRVMEPPDSLRGKTELASVPGRKFLFANWKSTLMFVVLATARIQAMLCAIAAVRGGSTTLVLPTWPASLSHSVIALPLLRSPFVYRRSSLPSLSQSVNRKAREGEVATEKRRQPEI